MSTTIAYSHKGGYWKTRYTFLASFMKSVGRKFFSSPASGASIVSAVQDSLLWKHNSTESTKRTNFYGTAGGSGLSVAFNDKVSSNKIYKSFSIEGTSNIEGLNTFVVNSDNTPDKQFSLGRLKDKGGVMYGHIGLSNTFLDGANIRPIGEIGRSSSQTSDGAAGFDYDPIEIVGGFLRCRFAKNVTQSLSSVGNIASPKAKYILLSQTASETPKLFSLYGQEITGFESGISYGNSILGPKTFFQKLTDPETNDIYLGFLSYNDSGVPVILDETHVQGDLAGKFTLLEITPQNINGSPPRGQYAQAEILLGSNPYEVVSLNVNYEPTDLDHSK